jgi:uncharacterized protein (DUF58 family)
VVKSRLLDEEFIKKIQGLELVSRKIVSGKMRGERRSRRRGHSNEFADYRPYVSGDDLRFLDWNIYGRLDRLFLKLFLEEEELWVHILLDRSRSMRFGDPDKFEYSKRIAAALAYIGLHNYDRVRVGAFSERMVPVFAPGRGPKQIARLFEALERLEPDEEGATDLARGCKDFAVAKRLSGVVVFISDFFDRKGFEAALRYLLSGGSQGEVFVIQVLAPQEIEPPLTGDLKLVDVEDGVEAEVSISAALLRSYRRNLEAFRSEIKEFASRRGLHYAFTSTAVGFDKLILEYLRRRGLLR